MSRLSLDQIPAGSTSERTCLRRIMAEEIEDLTRATFWRACAGEFLGTMILTMFAVGYGLHFPEQNGLSGLQAAIGVGLLLSTVIMLFSTVSGGHVNPVVSIGFAVVREISLVRFLLYCVSQCAGAIVGAGILKLIMPEAMHHNSGVIMPHDDVTDAQALITELIISFNLVFGVFALTDRGRKDIGGSVPVGVGIIVCINILFAMKSSGGCMNPARNFGPAVISGDWRRQWLYWVGGLLGGSIGSLLYEKVFSTSVTRVNMTKCLCGRRYDAVDDDSSGEVLREDTTKKQKPEEL